MVATPPLLDESRSWCPSCRYCQPVAATIAGEHSVAQRCSQHIMAFPIGAGCTTYEREPGSDDA